MTFFWWLGASATIFISYLIYVRIVAGKVKSVSFSFHAIPHPSMYTVAMVLSIMPLMVVAAKPLAFFAGCGIILAGMSPGMFDDVTEKTMHRIGAEGGMLLSALSMAVEQGTWYIALDLLVFTVYSVSKISKVKNHTYWIEVVFYFCNIISLIIFRYAEYKDHFVPQVG